MAKTEPRRGAAGYGHVFSRPLCKNQTEEEVTLAGLYARIKRARAATKKGLRLLKFARFGGVRSDKGSLRHNKNVLAITGVVVDYDGEKVPVGKAYRALRRAGIRALVYT